MRIYLDTCCICRRFDDQCQPAIARETTAITKIHQSFERGEHWWVTSSVVDDEIILLEDVFNRIRARGQLSRAHVWLELSERAMRLAAILHNKGISQYDALHVAVAYTGHCDVLLTTDHALVRRMARLTPSLGMPVINPVELRI